MTKWLRRVWMKLTLRKLDRQSTEEMKFHLDLETEAGIRAGLSPGEAARRARIRAGVIEASLDEVRDQRGLGWFDGSLMDFRHAASSLRRQPGFLFTAGGALAAAVAINTLIFTIINGVLLSPLPYPQPERLVRIYEWSAHNPKFPVSIYNYLEDKRETRLLDGIALYTRVDLQLMHEDRPEHLAAVAITDDFLPVLGIHPALGRNFTPADLHKDSRVVILSDNLWRSRFHSDPAIIGKTLRLNRENSEIVGVMPAGFQHVGGSYRSPLQGDTVQLWAPLSLDLPPNGQKNWHFTNAIARLKPGVSTQAAEAELNRIVEDLARRFPDSYKEKRAIVEPLATAVVGRSLLTVKIIASAGALVLLLACINIAGLSVARSLARRRELAIRQALGGNAWRVIRAVLAENVLVGLIGAAVGLAVAAALFPVLHHILPENFPRLHAIGFTWQAALFAFVTALATSIVAGLIPAFRQISVDPRQGLSEDNRATSGTRVTGLRTALVAAEIALSCVLCFSALLLVRSSRLVQARDHGFNPSGVLTFQIHLPGSAYKKSEQVSAFLTQAAERLQQIPGVQSAGLTSNLPWSGWDENTDFDIVGRAPRPGEGFQARYQAADPGTLKALGFHLISGRWLEPGDHLTAPKVVTINQAFARRYFDKEPVGQTLKLWGDARRIVGVVGDIHDHPADLDAEPAFWFPQAQQPFEAASAVIRTTGDPMSLLTGARAAIGSLDRELPLSEVRTLDDVAALALAERNFALWLCEAFAVLAMSLAAIGVYGMLTYTVAQRRREIGLRMALGASRPNVLWMILSSGLSVAAIGIAAGLLLAPLAGRAVKSLLYGVGSTDAITLAIAPLVIVLVALAGSLLPGWSAARSQPMSALREQ